MYIYEHNCIYNIYLQESAKNTSLETLFDPLTFQFSQALQDGEPF